MAVLALGLSGLIPFAATAIYLFISPAGNTADTVLQIQHAYAACILSFVGALHWAGSPRATDEAAGLLAAPWWRLTWGVIPSLWAWLAWVLPALSHRGMWLAAGLALALAFDWLTHTRWGWTRGFLYLRTVLSVVASICLVLPNMG
ncbi:hypothetical protein IP84_08720 [beta proteobacterium AAP99]|nr:hypothetical protein IP84_08720 [beta proteobacterium AAP99]